MRIKRVCAIVLMLALLSGFFLPSSAAITTDKESIRVGWFLQPGYQELDEQGNPYGFNYDYLMDIARYTGWTYDFVTTTPTGDTLDWNSGLAMLKSGELDIVGCLLYSAERAETYDFSAVPAGQSFTSLFVRNDSPLSRDDYPALDGITVAAATATLNDEDLLAYAQSCGFTLGEFLSCDSVAQVMDAVLTGKADAGVISSYQPDAQTRIISSFSPSSFYFGTTKGNTAILSGLNQAMNAILLSDPYYTQNLSARYGQTYQGKAVYTPSEKKYIDSRDPVVVCFSQSWFPLIQYDNNTGSASGIVPDILALISRDTGLTFTYRLVENYKEAVNAACAGECDILPCFDYDTHLAQKKGLSLTDTYMTLQLVLIRGTGESTADPVVAMPDRLANRNPLFGEGRTIRYYSSPQGCFEALKRGEATEVVLDSHTAAYYLSQTRYASYIRSALQSASSNICIAVSDAAQGSKILRAVLNKALSSITSSEISDIVLENTIADSSGFEAVVNRIPTMTAAIIILILFAFLLILLLFFGGYLRKSKEAKKSAEQVNAMLTTDELTGLLNENGFAMAAHQSLVRHPETPWFIVDFDIDYFEHFNAIYGFSKGDEILRLLAKLTRETYRDPGEVCGRIHADHFVCLATAESAQLLKERILRANRAFRELVEKNALLLSFGIYEIDDPSLPLSVMRDRALVAKRTVKGNYNNIVAVYDQALHEKQIEDLALVAYMDVGLKKGEFLAYYQPKFDMKTERIIGAEALVRWQHPKEGLIFPDRFIGLFEDNGQIGKLDFYMLEAVCKKLRQQQENGLTPVRVSVNFSRNHLYDPRFVEKLIHIVERQGISSELIEVEFTESAFLEGEERLLLVISGLHAAGFSVSIDDFGSGYSSLNMLKDIAFDVVKLDRGFLSATAATRRGQMVVQAVLQLAQDLQLTTVAEGVETKEQLDFLRENGCDIAQGYYFSKPLSGEAYDRCLAGGKGMEDDRHGA